jgi:mRNA interferase MazF
MIKTSVVIPEALFEQAETLALRLDISQGRLFELALEQFVRAYGQQSPPAERIQQGDIYWVRLEGLDESEPGIPHPHVVVQADVLNHSRLSTVVVCALTSNVQRASLPGNVLLDAGEGDLPRPSVVEVSKVSSVEKAQLGEYIGSLTAPRIDQILAGMQFLQRSFFTR